ncbi:hypothetical protein ID866_6841 [Astraeus odoratus]|nr:hypothetical protein ID866_6841 [Astraeus odoratus]
MSANTRPRTHKTWGSGGESSDHRSSHDMLPVSPAESNTATATAKTVIRIVQGSIVTYCGGLGISRIVTGFESCTLRIKNLPADTKDDDVCALFKQQGLANDCFCLVSVSKTDGTKVEAEVLVDAKLGERLHAGLDGMEFRDVVLDVDMPTISAAGGMASSSVQDATVLTLSWRNRPLLYIAEYVDEADARAKVQELNGRALSGRRVKVEMNSAPFQSHSIVLTNIPMETTDAEIMAFTGTSSVKRGTESTSVAVHDVENTVREVIHDTFPGDLQALEQIITPHPRGHISIRVRFRSREGALAVQRHFESRKYGEGAGMRCHLPRGMDFTMSIAKGQYAAQRAQWDDLISSIKDPKASGSQDDALGALKVRVESLAMGNAVEGWHRSLTRPGNKFVQQVIDETGAYVRADLKAQVLRVYGSSASVTHARNMISDELKRLSSAEYTTTIPREVVGVFIRKGLAQLKETFGEDSVKFDLP